MTRATDPSRDLLFGLLALQTGLINQAQLVAAFHAWTQARDRPMAEILAEQGALETNCLTAVEALVIEHLRRHGSDPERSLAAIGVGRSTRACLAQIGNRELDASLAQVGSGSTEHDTDPYRTASYSVGSATSDGQRFRVLRPHARGGLGAVFVALDTELHREVALKQILEAHADDETSRSRFLLEAEITGGLEHPGIVPVYGLGSYDDGRPYYAMRFIRGDSLKEAIEHFHARHGNRPVGWVERSEAHQSASATQPVGLDDSTHPTNDPGRRSLELRKLLRRFLDICNAIDYAHSRGVLHRDLKPGNVIVGRHGETLVVDWGLAKATGQSDPSSGERTLRPSSASGSAETLPGSALGTPAYMSPEQAEGDLEHLGPRSDVYSLGATLYCLLTGRPPYAGDPMDVIPRVQRGDFRPPRAIDPSIDRALEAVCLKAMALNPEDRYGSGRALAEDIERWMADEPVSAWREPLARRARRWARRNRSLVTGAAAALLAGVVGLAAVLAVQTRAKAELARSLANETKANQALGAANAELARSRAAVQARYDLAVAAIKTFHTGVSEDFLLKEDRFQELRDRLLKSAGDFYGRLGALLGRESDRASRRALLQANFEVAELTGKVGQSAAALAAHRRVLAAREVLAGEAVASAELKADVGRSLTAVAGLLSATGQTDEALTTFRKAEGLLAELAESASARSALAACRSRLGWLLHETGHAGDGLAVLRLARAEQEVLASAAGAATEARADLAATGTRIGMLLSATGQPTEAEGEYRRALSIQQKLAEDNPTDIQFRSSLASSHGNLGLLMSATGRLAAAEVELRGAMVLFQKLAEDHPAVTQFRNLLANVHNQLGNLLSNTGRPTGAEGEYRQVLALQQKLADDHPTVTQFRSLLAGSHMNLGVLLSTTGQPAGGEAEFRRAVAHLQKLADENPAVTRFRNQLAMSHGNLGILLSSTGRPLEAETEHRRVLAIRQKLADENPAVTEFRHHLAGSHNDLGNVLTSTGRLASAEAEYRQAAAILQRLAEDQPAVTLHRSRLANMQNNLGIVLTEMGRLTAAAAEFRRAAAILQRLVEDNPAVTEFRDYLANSHEGLGSVLSQTGRPAAAEGAYRQALAIRQKLGEDNPQIPGNRDAVASGHTYLADVLRGRGRCAEAIGDYDRAIAIRQRLVQENPTVADYRSGLAYSLRCRGLARGALGDATGAASDVRQALGLYEGLPTRSGEQWYETACCRAALAGLAGVAGSGITTAEGESEADAAMGRLRKALAMGYRNLAAMMTEAGLDSLRARPDFPLLLMDLAFPAEPFAYGD
jgi:serine/threonine-protein kinase